MNRKTLRIQTVDQSNDATCIGNKRGMAKRAKRKSSKKLRQLLAKQDD